MKHFQLISIAILIAFLLLLPSYILPSCPKGLVNDHFPGRCGLYADENQDQICDLSQTTMITTAPKTFNFAFSWQTGVFLFLFLAAIILAVKVKPVYRYLLLIFSLFFAFFAFKNLCPIAFLQFLFIFKDQAVLNLFPFLLFLSTIITTIFFGRIFCGWICPIGAVQELIFKGPRWLKVKLPSLTKKIPPALKALPFLILVIIGFWTIRSGKTIFCQLDPFGYLFGLSTNLLLLGALLTLLLISLFIFRPFCLLLCPLGAIFSSLSSASVWRIKRSKQCSDCKLCIQKCPVGAIDQKLKVDQKACLHCQECLIACPKNALSYQS